MRLLPVVLVAVLLLPACSGETACERYERIGSAADADNQDASPEEVAEATQALADCMAEEAEPRGQASASGRRLAGRLARRAASPRS